MLKQKSTYTTSKARISSGLFAFFPRRLYGKVSADVSVCVGVYVCAELFWNEQLLDKNVIKLRNVISQELWMQINIECTNFFS